MKKVLPQLPKDYFVRKGWFKGWLILNPNWTKEEIEAVKEYLSYKDNTSSK